MIKFLTAAAALMLTACAHEVAKEKYPPTANPVAAVDELNQTVKQGYADQLDVLAKEDFDKGQQLIEEARKQINDKAPQKKSLETLSYARAYLLKARSEA